MLLCSCSLGRSLPSLCYCRWFVEDLVVTVLLVNLCCFIYQGVTIFCLCLSVYFSVTNGFIPFRLPLVDALSVSFPGGSREVFLFRGLAGDFSNICNGFSALIQISLTDTALALTCKSQVNVFLSTPACFRSPTNSTGKFIVELLVEFCSLLRCIRWSSLGPI